MLHIMHVSWFYFFTFLILIHKEHVQGNSVEAFEGETVVLPCLFSQKPLDVSWQDKEGKTVYDIINGVADYNDQSSAYTGRVEHFELEMKNGNFSIMLKNTSKSDEGTYTCSTPNINPPQYVTLTFKERQTPTMKTNRRISATSTAPNNSKSIRRANGLLMFLLGCALLYSLTF